MEKKFFLMTIMVIIACVNMNAQIKSAGYFRLHHKDTYGERFLSVIGSQTKDFNQDTRELSSTRMLSSPNQLSDAGTVIYVSGDFTGNGGITNAKAVAQGVSTESLSEKYPIYVDYSENGYTIYIKIEKKIFGYTYTTNGYLKDYGSTTAVVYSGETDQYWNLEPLDGSDTDSYFGAVPSVTTSNNGYYTTMYTTFPYKLSSGVEAYRYDNGLVNINHDTIPSYTPVVLKLNGNEAKDNILIPSLEEPNYKVGNNELIGVLSLYDGTNDDYLTKYNPETMLLLAQDGENVTFANVTDNSISSLPNNTAYLPASALANADQRAKLTRGTAGINGFKATKEETNEIYDLQGCRIKKPGKGIYIVNGKKVVL